MPEDFELTSYDNLNTDDYLEHVERPLSWNNLYERPAMIERLPNLTGKNVLDLGCASGYFSEYALKQGAKVTAVDISQKMLDKLAASVKSEGLEIHRADLAQPMPFLKTNNYDCVIASLVLHYIKDWKPLLAELYRVVKKGGRVIISTHHPLATFNHLEFDNYFEFKMVEEVWGQNGPHPFTVCYYKRPINEILRPILESEFKVISIDEPLPNKKCKELDPRSYKRLMERPAFLFIVLEK
ncbi:MAG: class I SAM-dependent methyltransferase [Dehalococcoidales bacterium]|nr:class I SAM-dependent methyltransferase [Dehalococcoidales bacterium]